MYHDDIIHSICEQSKGIINPEDYGVFYFNYEEISQDSFSETSKEFFNESVISFPFNLNFFVYKVNGINTFSLSIAKNKKKDGYVITYFDKKDDGIRTRSYKSFINLNGEIFSYNCIDENEKKHSYYAIKMALNSILALNTKEFNKEKNILNNALNKKREKKGRNKLLNYNVIYINKKINQSNGNQKNSYAKIPHWRRGHIRTYKNGKKTMVSPTIVNFNGKAPDKKIYVA